MKITAQLLIDHDACSDQVKLFIKHFPKGTTVTVARCVKVAHIFNWDWAAEHLLSVPALNAYNEACAPARKAYGEARVTALNAYYEVCATAFANATKVGG